MALELIVGVEHLPEIVGLCDNLISSKFPEGVKSIMLELPPNDRYHKIWEKEPFFGELSKRYGSRGANVIWGDIKRKKTPRYMNSIVTEPVGVWSERDIFKSLVYNFGLLVSTIIEDNITHTREIGMNDEIERTQPQVVVSGINHSDSFKKSHMNVHYVLIISKDLAGKESFKRYLKKPFHADEIINFDKQSDFLLVNSKAI